MAAVPVPPASSSCSLPLALARGIQEQGVLGAVRQFFICGASTNGLIQTHLVSLCADYGVTEVRRRPLWR